MHRRSSGRLQAATRSRAPNTPIKGFASVLEELARFCDARAQPCMPRIACASVLEQPASCEALGELSRDYSRAGQDQQACICVRCHMQSVLDPSVGPSLRHCTIDGSGSGSGILPGDAQEATASTLNCVQTRPVEKRKTTADTHFKRAFCQVPANRSPILLLSHRVAIRPTCFCESVSRITCRCAIRRNCCLQRPRCRIRKRV